MKARLIYKVEVEVFCRGSVWVFISWDGKPARTEPDGTKIRNRFYSATDPDGCRRILKRGRQMQDIILAKTHAEANQPTHTVIGLGQDGCC